MLLVSVALHPLLQVDMKLSSTKVSPIFVSMEVGCRVALRSC